MTELSQKMGNYRYRILALVFIATTIRQAFSLIGFIVARFGLGIGESGNFPAAIKTVAEWFPKKDRAFATGIFDASTLVTKSYENLK
jgi:ACS family hexuronate transporter-like MFS transporter